MKEYLYVQTSYVSQIKYRLALFTDKGNNLFNFRCPFCGDSSRSQTKKRGYLFRDHKDGLLHFQCHNCGINRKFSNFLKDIDPALYSKYRLEAFTNKTTKINSFEPLKKVEIESPLDTARCVPVSELSRVHTVNQYLNERMIPKAAREQLYFTENLRQFCSSINSTVSVPESARLLLLELDEQENVKIIIARAIDDSASRYMMYRIDEEYPKIFGLSRVNKNKHVYVVEGAIDSLLLPNAVAVLNTNLLAYEKYDITFPNATHVLDNDPRNRFVVNQMRRLIDAGKRVFIPIRNYQYEDINDMHKAGINLVDEIESRTFSGILARLAFGAWKQI